MAEFYRVFGGVATEDLEGAFREHRLGSKFFPCIKEINDLLRDRWRKRRLQMEEALAENDRRDIERARRDGKLISYPEVIAALQERQKAIPDPEFLTRKKVIEAKMASVSQIVPSLQLSEEQIAARREKERKECERYRFHSNADER